MADDLKKYLKQPVAKQDATRKVALKPRQVSTQNDVLTQFGNPFLDKGQGEIKPYKEPDNRAKLAAFANYLDRDGKSPVGSLISEPLKSAARLARPSQYLDKIRTESDILPTLGEAGMDVANVAGSVAEIGGTGLNLIGKINHPLTKTLKPALKMKEMGTWGTAAAMSVGESLAPAIMKTPGLNRLYKGLAYHVATQGSAPFREMEHITTALKDAIKTPRRLINSSERGVKLTGPSAKLGAISYNGSMAPDGRNLIHAYIYGPGKNFIPSELPTIGLERYFKRYGDLKKYNMDVTSAAGGEATVNARVLGDKLIEKRLGPTRTTDPQYFKKYNDMTEEIHDTGLEQSFHNYMKENNTDHIGFGVEGTDVVRIKDDVAGHMGYVVKKPDGNLAYRSQDIWKFTPEDYNKKWNYNEAPHYKPNTSMTRGNLKDILDKYTKTKQAGLMEKSGKPFILLDERPIDFSVPKISEVEHSTPIGSIDSQLDHVDYEGDMDDFWGVADEDDMHMTNEDMEAFHGIEPSTTSNKPTEWNKVETSKYHNELDYQFTPKPGIVNGFHYEPLYKQGDMLEDGSKITKTWKTLGGKYGFTFESPSALKLK